MVRKLHRLELPGDSERERRRIPFSRMSGAPTGRRWWKVVLGKSVNGEINLGSVEDLGLGKV